MQRSLKVLSLVALVTILAAPLAAADYREEVLARLSSLEEKIVGLAEAVPADNYTYRPMEGVRSISEVYLHVAAANYGIPRTFGTQPPEGFNGRGYDKHTTNKAEILPKLKASFAHIRSAFEKLTPGDEEKTVKLFGQEMTTRGALWRTLEHLSEHLGQSIAYARSNKVVPPWSQGDS